MLQLALKLPMPKLAELICELCSTYYYDLAEVPQLSRSEDGLLSRVEVQECARSNRPVPVPVGDGAHGDGGAFVIACSAG